MVPGRHKVACRAAILTGIREKLVMPYSAIILPSTPGIVYLNVLLRSPNAKTF